MFSYMDKFDLLFRHTIYVDVADRQEFYDYLSARLEEKIDWTSKLVLEGGFEDDPYENPYYDIIS